MGENVLKLYGDVNTYTHNPAFPTPDVQFFLDFKKELEVDDGWTLDSDKNGTKVFFRDKENQEILQFKLRSTELHEFDIRVLYDVFQDPEFRDKWDTSMANQHLVEQLDENSEVGYYSVKMPFMLANRDWVNMRSWWHNREETVFIIINHSVPHEKEPVRKDFVRAQSLKTGYMLEKTPEGTLLSFFSWNSWNGWIPTWAVNKATKSMIKSVIGQIRDAAQKYPAWKEKHNPDDKYWLRTNEKYLVEE